MSEAVTRANLPTGQSLPVSRDGRRGRQGPGSKTPRHETPEQTPPEAPDPAAGQADVDETGHVDVLM